RRGISVRHWDRFLADGRSGRRWYPAPVNLWPRLSSDEEGRRVSPVAYPGNWAAMGLVWLATTWCAPVQGSHLGNLSEARTCDFNVERGNILSRMAARRGQSECTDYTFARDDGVGLCAREQPKRQPMPQPEASATAVRPSYPWTFGDDSDADRTVHCDCR